jgi:hypothetical protein
MNKDESSRRSFISKTLAATIAAGAIPTALQGADDPTPQQDRKVTKSDLAFIDAAIQLHKASKLPKDRGAFVSASAPVACDVVDVVAAAAAVAVVVWHWYNSCLVGDENPAFQLAQKLKLEPNISLERLMQNRANLAKELGVK